MERTCVIVAFGDVAGFNPWIRRGSNAPEVIHDFVTNFYRELQTFVLNHKDVQIKYLGDGFMILKELKSTCTKGVCVAQFITDIAMMSRRLSSVVRKCDFPPPDGFRVRIAHGHVSKIQVLDPVDGERKRKIWEFVGYAVNLAQKLLDVSPSTLLVLHESVIQVLGRKKARFRLRRLVAGTEQPRGVDSEDIAELWVCEL